MTFFRLAVVLSLLELGLCLPASGAPPEPQRVSRVNEGWPVGDFTLVDQEGNPFTRERLLGRWTFVLFGDARCAESCTAPLSALTGMGERIARTQKLKTTQVVFISVAGDTPEQLRQFLAPFDDRIVAASGSPQIVRKLADDLGVADALPQPSSEPAARASRYPGLLSLVDPEGVVWGQFLPPFDVMQLTARYLKTRARR